MNPNVTRGFRSQEGADRVRSEYDRILRFFPFAQRYVDTSYGRTFVLEAGRADAPPVLLLHGSCSSSFAWLGDIPVLAASFHVFAADLLGEPGNSEDRRPDYLSDAPVRWLEELLDGLGIARAMILGNSMGGWLALQFAAGHPERTQALALLAPSGIVPPNPAFVAMAADYAVNGKGGADTANAVFADASLPKEVREFMQLILENFNPYIGPLPVLSDAGMRALTMPVLLIAGTSDVTMDAVQAAARLRTFAPHARIRLIENGSHLVLDAMGTVVPFFQESAT